MTRLRTAWKAFWSILQSTQRAAEWEAFISGSTPALEQAAAEPKEPVAPLSGTADAVYTLVLLQREGRLVDFLLESIDQYQDAQVGAAVRQIHANCRKVLDKHFGVVPVRCEQEGATIEVLPSFDARQLRVVGSPAGQPPFRGTLKHHGWRASKVDLPQRHEMLDPTVICPAEVEVRNR